MTHRRHTGALAPQPGLSPAGLILTISLALSGCAPALVDDETPTPGEASPGETGAVTALEERGDLTLTRVDAQSNEAWIYLDLDTGAEVEGEDAAADPTWDLAFQRFIIALNGGAGGPGEVSAAILLGGDFDALERAPASGYLSDEEDGDGDGDPERVFDAWYDYDPSTHVLTPADLVYVVRTGEGAYMKLEMAAYYDDAGTAGFPSFWWGPVDAP